MFAPPPSSFCCLAFNRSIADEWTSKAAAGPQALPAHPFTPEQQAILRFAQDSSASFLMKARAGTGKSATLFYVLRALDLWPSVTTRQAKDGTSYTSCPSIKTYHAAGRAAWLKKGLPFSQFGGTVQSKDRNIAKDLNLFKQPPTAPGSRPEQPIAFSALALVKKAKMLGLSPADRGTPLLEDTDQNWMEMAEHFSIPADSRHIAAARAILDESINQGKKPQEVRFRNGKTVKTILIDFADMLYLPVLFNAPFDRFDLLLLDEVQDASAIRQQAARLMLQKGGRVIAAGDDCQAIYGFTGAAPAAMRDLIEAFGLAELPLCTSFRCSQSVIREAQKIVPDIRALPSAPEGQVSAQLEPIAVSSLPSTGLCRNNAPIALLAVHSLRSRRPVAILGRADIFEELQELFRSAQGSIPALARDFPELLRAHLLPLVKKNKHLRKSLEDKAAALLALCSAVEAEDPNAPADRVLTLLDSLYPKDEDLLRLRPDTLLLSTIHKSKGLEWPSVFILDPALIGQYAKQDWEHEAEQNLLYVGITRAKHSLLYVDSAQILGLLDEPHTTLSLQPDDEEDDEDDAAPTPPPLPAAKPAPKVARQATTIPPTPPASVEDLF